MICQSMKAKPDVSPSKTPSTHPFSFTSKQPKTHPTFQIDMEKFAALGGFTKASASVIAGRTLKKAMANGSGVAATPETGGKGSARKRKAGMYTSSSSSSSGFFDRLVFVVVVAAKDGDDAEETPSKTRKSKMAKPASDNEGEGEGDGDEIVVKCEKQEFEGADESV